MRRKTISSPLSRRRNTMLVLTRKPGEKAHIGSDITFTVLETKGNRVRIGIDAPTHVPIVREELCDSRSELLAIKECKRRETCHAAANT
jgi:carbon storage regulator